jgi:hypothetical protein
MTDSDQVHPLFFLSYARLGQGESDRAVTEFFNDLSRDVKVLVSRRPGADPGFMDRSIRSGQRWTDELLWAIGNCDVFVPLLCLPYTSSRWCGMEWYAFSHRKGSSEAAHSQPAAIIPIIWAPFSEAQMSPAIGKVQRFSPGDMLGDNVQAEYEQHGVSGLMWLMRTVPYRWVVWRLALEIARYHIDYDQSVIRRKLSEPDLHDAFRENES